MVSATVSLAATIFSGCNGRDELVSDKDYGVLVHTCSTDTTAGALAMDRQRSCTPSGSPPTLAAVFI
jgi:hypothetical protein